MICKMCATGADVISRASELAEKFDLETNDDVNEYVEELKITGRSMHLFCAGIGSCDCQHRTQERGKNVVRVNV